MREGRRRRRRRLKGAHISHPILWNFLPSITWTLEVCSQFFLAVSQMGHSINSRLPAAAAEISRNSPVMKSLWCIVQFVPAPLFCFNDPRRVTNAFVFLYLHMIVHRKRIHTLNNSLYTFKPLRNSPGRTCYAYVCFNVTINRAYSRLSCIAVCVDFN